MMITPFLMSRQVAVYISLYRWEINAPKSNLFYYIPSQRPSARKTFFAALSKDYLYIHGKHFYTPFRKKQSI